MVIKFLFPKLVAAVQVFLRLHNPSYIPMSRLASQSLKKLLLCNAFIFVYKVFSRLHLITTLQISQPRKHCTSERFLCDRKFFHLLKLKICGSKSKKSSLSQRGTRLFWSAKVSLIAPAANVYILVIEVNQ